MKTVNTILFTSWLALGGSAALVLTSSSAHAQAPAEAAKAKKTRMAKLQAIGRAYQVAFGRGLKREEAPSLVNMTKPQLVQHVLKSPELTKVFASRLANYAEGTEAASNPTELDVPQAIKQAAQPTAKLDEVLKTIARKRHKGDSCGDKPNSVCFARWLVGRVAPALGRDWLTKNEAAIPGWDYAKLLEQITMASL